MVETLPAFIAVIIAADALASHAAYAAIGWWAQVFFVARAAHAVVYITGIPYLRTPVYLVSWLAILMIGTELV